MNKEFIQEAVGLIILFILTLAILFAGVPVAWLSVHGAESGYPSLESLVPF